MINTDEIRSLEQKWGKQRVLDTMIYLEHAVDHRGILRPVEVTAQSVTRLLESVYMEPVSLELSALGHLREARAKLLEENEGVGRTRELSVAITNLDTAILWHEYDQKTKAPPVNLKQGKA